MLTKVTHCWKPSYNVPLFYMGRHPERSYSKWSHKPIETNWKYKTALFFRNKSAKKKLRKTMKICICLTFWVLSMKTRLAYSPAKSVLLHATATFATAWQQALPEAPGEQRAGNRQRPSVRHWNQFGPIIVQYMENEKRAKTGKVLQSSKLIPKNMWFHESLGFIVYHDPNYLSLFCFQTSLCVPSSMCPP